MYISMNWISDFVDLSGLDLEALIHRFTLSTAEVEDVYKKGEDTRDVVVARIESIENHPNSQKLHLLKVNDGEKLWDCVCGAPNVRVGMVVPFAREGGCVSGNDIKCATIAGVESHGMCCSEAELGISADNSGLMEITDGTPLGTQMTDAYSIKDIVFEVDNKSLTNRPDLWGHYGIAREFSALTGRPLKPLETLDCSVYKELEPVSIDVIDREHTYRYSGLKVENIKEKVSPVDMRIRLFYCGSRAINLLADLTNYIMLEMGQPMHAFDKRCVDHVEVRRFDHPFTFTTLDGQERAIDENTLMITSSGEPVAIAGVMGGLATEIEDDTDSLLLESANFDGVCIRKTETRLGLRTDASIRYEKVLDPEMTVTAIERFMKLLVAIDPDVQVVSSLTDVYVKKYDTITLHFDKHFVDRYTGISIENERILHTLRSLGFTVTCENDAFTVTVPSWRATKDVTIPADIIEEITRIYGYDNFEIKTTLSALRPVRDSVGRVDDNGTKDLLVKKFKLHEVHSYIWNDAKKYREIGIEPEANVRLLNSINPDNDTLRNCICPTLLAFVDDNKQYAPHFGIFEIARVVEGLKENGECNERKKLGIALFSRNQNKKELFFALRDMLITLGMTLKHTAPDFAHTAPTHNWQHPKNTISVSMNGKTLGFLCALHPTVVDRIDKKAAIVCAQIDMDTLAEIGVAELPYREPSKFPGIDIDLTLAVQPETRYADLAECWAEGIENLQNAGLVAIYESDGTRSITVRLTFASNEKTLSKNEVQTQVDEVLSRMQAKGISLKM